MAFLMGTTVTGAMMFRVSEWSCTSTHKYVFMVRCGA